MWIMIHTMQTIQVVLGEDLLRAADRAARKSKLNRSALIRQALREHLRRIQEHEKERRDREGYSRHPESPGEFAVWDRVAAWPDE